MPNPPTNWFWNIRVGDKIQINNAGPWYTVVGPMAIASGTTSTGATQPRDVRECRAAGIRSPLVAATARRCDAAISPISSSSSTAGRQQQRLDRRGMGWGGQQRRTACQRAGMNGESDRVGARAMCSARPSNRLFTTCVNQVYTIKRRPGPVAQCPRDRPADGRRDRPDRLGVVPERERPTVPPRTNDPACRRRCFQLQYTGYVDIVLNPDGTVLPTTVYSSPSSFSLGSAFVPPLAGRAGRPGRAEPGADCNPVLAGAPGHWRRLDLRRSGAQGRIRAGHAVHADRSDPSHSNMPFLFNPDAGGSPITRRGLRTRCKLQSQLSYTQAQQGVKGGHDRMATASDSRVRRLLTIGNPLGLHSKEGTGIRTRVRIAQRRRHRRASR